MCLGSSVQNGNIFSDCERSVSIMKVWIVLILCIVMLSQHDCENCDFTAYPRPEYTRKKCRPHESQGSDSCEVLPVLYVNDSVAGTVIVEFNILSKSCNVSSYEFSLKVDDRLNETNCKNTLFSGNAHSAERIVSISYDETVESCGKTQSVLLEHVYQGCYSLEYTYKGDNNSTKEHMTQYLKTTYKKEEAPCDNTYITPNNIKRNTVEISMDNFSKFDRIEATVTKPVGEFICDQNTKLERFMWVMTYDSNGTFMCKRSGEKHKEEISCEKYNHNIKCTLQNIPPGNYCYYVFMSNVYCNPINSKRGLHQKFTIPEDPQPARALEQTSDIHIILIVVFLCLMTACVVVIVIIRKRKKASLLELYFNVEEYPLPQIPKILLLYSRDCKQFMEMMITFRDLLEEMTKCKVYDCFDPFLGEEVGQSKVDWMQSCVSSDDFKIVVVESSVAVIHQQALLCHTKVGYREPTWLDELFIYGLRELRDDLQRNVYQRVFVIRIDGFTEEKDFLKHLVPYKRYILPQHLGMLLNDLSLQSNLRVVPCYDDINDGNLQKFEQDLKNLVNYKRLYPDYLDELISRESYVNVFSR